MRLLISLALLLSIAGCGTLVKPPPPPVASPETSRSTDPRTHEIVMFALGLIDTGYRFGGKNPEAGLDCSGMVNYVFENAAGLRLAGSAADMAKLGRPVNGDGLRPGDLVFFNTRNKPRSHVGIYIGDGRFIHAPNTNGKVRADSLTQGWFATRFEEARTYFD
ncbi:MAG: C40 family peptidase [Rhodocyclaceae bacterium]|nr:C40 family peptidase [Rhodocyclaceae bacterium]